MRKTRKKIWIDFERSAWGLSEEFCDMLEIIEETSHVISQDYGLDGLVQLKISTNEGLYPWVLTKVQEDEDYREAYDIIRYRTQTGRRVEFCSDGLETVFGEIPEFISFKLA